jgi:hypothetical protein
LRGQRVQGSIKSHNCSADLSDWFTLLPVTFKTPI